MKIGQWIAIACGVALIAGTTNAPAQATSAVTASAVDGLVEVKSKDFDRVYVRPGTDFRAYTKVMLGPTQVAFADRWLSDMNFHRIAVLQGTTAADAERIAQDTRTGLRDVFAAQFQRAGYEVVAAPGAGVLGLSVNVVDLYVNAPASITQALPSRVYTHEAGFATLVLEVHDSTTGTLLARIVDRRTVGLRGGPHPNVRITTVASNRFDFGTTFSLWAQNSIDELKSASLLAMNGPAQGPPH